MNSVWRVSNGNFNDNENNDDAIYTAVVVVYRRRSENEWQNASYECNNNEQSSKMKCEWKSIHVWILKEK